MGGAGGKGGIVGRTGGGVGVRGLTAGGSVGGADGVGKLGGGAVWFVGFFVSKENGWPMGAENGSGFGEAVGGVRGFSIGLISSRLGRGGREVFVGGVSISILGKAGWIFMGAGAVLSRGVFSWPAGVGARILGSSRVKLDVVGFWPFLRASKSLAIVRIL